MVNQDLAVPCSAATASLLSTTIGFPIDSVKSRLQTFKYPSILDCIKATYATERLAGFFRGLGAPLVTTTLARTISFSVYSKMRDRGVHPFLAGATSGLTISIWAAPFELTKIASQLSVLMSKGDAASSRQAAASIYKTKGLKGFYTGYLWHGIRDSIGTGMFFYTYSTVKDDLLTRPGEKSPTWAIALSGGLCGIIAWTAVYPIDTIKARVQRDALRGQTKPSPWPRLRTLYRGCSVSLFRSGLINAVNFLVYEKLLSIISDEIVKPSVSA